MKKIIFFFTLLLAHTGISQVGINTDTPTTMLDVNGNLRIRTLTDGSNSTT